MSEKAHLDAVMALLTAADARPYTLGDLKAMDPSPTSYNEVHVMQKFSEGPRRSGAASAVTQWRVLTRAVADSYANAQEMRARAATLHEAKITVAGEEFFIERAVSDEPIAEDGPGWWSGTSEFAY